MKALLRNLIFVTGLVVWIALGATFAGFLLVQLACLLIRDPEDGFDDEEW